MVSVGARDAFLFGVGQIVSVTRAAAENRAGFVSRSQMKVVILCGWTEELWDMLEVFVQTRSERRSPVTREHHQTGRAEGHEGRG